MGRFITSKESSQESSRESSRKSSQESSQPVVAVDVVLLPGLKPGKKEVGGADPDADPDADPNADPDTAPVPAPASPPAPPTIPPGGPVTCSSDDDPSPRPFELLVDLALQDTHWLRILAGESGLPLVEQRAALSAFLKERILLIGKESEIRTAGNVKAYLRNLLRNGQDTYNEIRKRLTESASLRPVAGHTNCGAAVLIKVGYEDLNPLTGERSYCGFKIPPHAPARPNVKAVWNGKEWED